MNTHGFNHAQCYACWYEERGDAEPHRVIGAEPDHCCYCGIPTRSGIYRRAAPQSPQIPHCPDRGVYVITGAS